MEKRDLLFVSVDVNRVRKIAPSTKTIRKNAQNLVTPFPLFVDDINEWPTCRKTTAKSILTVN